MVYNNTYTDTNSSQSRLRHPHPTTHHNNMTHHLIIKAFCQLTVVVVVVDLVVVVWWIWNRPLAPSSAREWLLYRMCIYYHCSSSSSSPLPLVYALMSILMMMIHPWLVRSLPPPTVLLCCAVPSPHPLNDRAPTSAGRPLTRPNELLSAIKQNGNCRNFVISEWQMTTSIVYIYLYKLC